MSLPPIYDLFRQRGIRFVEHSAQFKTNCPKCQRENVNVAELDDDGLGVRFRCECGFVAAARVRPTGAKLGGNGAPPGDAEYQRKYEDALRELGTEPEQPQTAPAPEGKTAGEDGAGGAEGQSSPSASAASSAPAGDGSYTHVWRSKDYDYPCTPTGEEQRDDAGRIYAQVRTPDGDQSFVPKDELIAKDEASFLAAALARLKEKKGLDFADLGQEISAAEARGYDDVVRALRALVKPFPRPSLHDRVEHALKESPHGPFSDEVVEKFKRLLREQPAEFARLCARYRALAAAVPLDAATVKAALEQVSKEQAPKLFIALVLAADLDPVETDTLLRLAAKRAGVTLRPLTAMLKLAQAEQAGQRAREERARRRAERTDPRPMVDVPAYSDPFMPVMIMLNAVVGVAQKTEPPARDIDGVSTRARKLSVPKMHAFDQTQANVGDDDDD